MNIKYQYNYITGLLKRYGFRGLVLKTLERSKSPMLAYTNCYEKYMPSEEELEQQKKTPLFYAPLVSIVIPAYETAEAFLRELMDSLLAQTYPNWELCLADGSKSDAVYRVAEEYQKKDERIRYRKLEKNGGISDNTNGGFEMARGEFIALMDHDDILTPNALYEMIRCLNDSFGEKERNLAMIYSDEDKMNSDGTIFSRPHFKPDYNPEFLRRNNYFCHFLIFSKELLQKTGGLDSSFDGAQDYDFVLRCTEAGAIIRHVPKILYHWRIHEGSTAGNSADKSYAFDNGCRAIEAHLARIGEPGRAEITTNLGVYKVTYTLQGSYSVTVVAEQQAQLVKIRNYYKKEQDKNKEYQLNIRYLLAEQLNNGVVKECIGDYVLFICRDTWAEPENLIENMLRICQHEQIGIVGAKLLTKKKKVASCGMIYDEDGAFVQSCGGIPAEYKGYFLHAVIPQNVSALLFQCVMFSKKLWEKTGGFDENYSGIYRDADYCFRLQKLGYQVVMTPEVTAVTREGNLAEEDENAFNTAIRQNFVQKWSGKLKKGDPCYNCNLSLKPQSTYGMKE